MDEGPSEKLLRALTERGFMVTEGQVTEVVDSFQRAHADAAATWPGVHLAEEVFAEYLAERLPLQPALTEALQTVHVGDLYLCCACLAGDRVALNAFSTTFDEVVRGVLLRVQRQGVDVDEAKQRVLERLLVSSEDRNPALASYGGQGRLGSFIRTCVLREAFKLIRKGKREPAQTTGSDEDALLRLVEQSEDAELATLKARYRDQLRTALRDALASLPVADRNMLRYHYVSGLSTRQIAGIVGASFKTVARRLVRIRADLFDATRAQLMERAGVGARDFHSIARLVESQLDLSLERLLDLK